MPNTINIDQSAISTENNQITTTSLKVAEAFNKLHKDILKKITNLECSSNFNQRNFAPVEYLDKKGEARKAYRMTKDGFMFLVMGFTGKAAAQIKEAYINAFNAMTEQIQKQQFPPQKKYFTLEDFTDIAKPFLINGIQGTPLLTQDGKAWITTNTLGKLLGYKRRDICEVLFGKHGDKFPSDTYGWLKIAIDGKEKNIFMLSSESWIKIASLSRCSFKDEVIKAALVYHSDTVLIQKKDWEQLQHHAKNTEIQYKQIADAANQLNQAVCNAHSSIGIVSIITKQ